MIRRVALLLALLAVPAAFVAGWWMRGGAPVEGSSERRVLYYVDPMNPEFHSPKPGVAPCGMPLEPVYADGGGGDAAAGALSTGQIRVRADRQQLIGIEVEPLERGPVRHTLRLLGRVAPDETRVHVVDTEVHGWVREVAPVTTGSLVRERDLLGEFYSEELVGPQQTFVNALRALDDLATKQDPASQRQTALEQRTMRSARLSLQNQGVSEEQLDEIERTRSMTTRIQVRAPTTGYVLERNFSLGQRFTPFTALFVIADLRRVFVLADAFAADAEFFPAGADVTVRLPDGARAFPAKASRIPPRFDASSRTSKVRIEVDNPELALVPEMFVDVLREVVLEDALSVAAGAVIDSGRRKVVFVDLGDGVFEPREVTTGARLGERVLILSGLEPGARVVVSGNFLLDSESRMRTGSTP